MPKLMGNLQIKVQQGSDGARPHFEITFVPYAGRLNTKAAVATNHEDLVTLLIDLRIGEDEASKWAGRARAQGVVLIPSFERTDAFLKEMGLLA
jgi:hypothetical protein